MFKFLFQLNDSILTSLKLNSFPSNFGLKLCYSLHGFIELAFTFTLFCLPRHCDLLDSLNFTLLEPSLELLLLRSLPQFELPHSLIFLVLLSIGVPVLLTTDDNTGCRLLSSHVSGNYSHILKINDATSETLS